MFHMIALEQMFVNGPLQKISLAAVSESIRSVIYISLLNISLFYCVGFSNVGYDEISFRPEKGFDILDCLWRADTPEAGRRDQGFFLRCFSRFL